MRRARRLDLAPDGRFDVHFRDSHLADEGEIVLHEYAVAGRVAGGAIVEIEPQARVLPWTECPAALASAQRVVGVALDDLPAVVRADFRGTSTCTHLNDTLRSLADLGVLATWAGRDRAGR
jgi:hypothetical protein